MHLTNVFFGGMCLKRNKFYYPTDARNIKGKLCIQKCKDDYQLTRELIRKPRKG